MRKGESRSLREAPDVATPLTDALINNMLHGDGIPRCKEWELLEAHAREMERLYYAQRAVSAALLK